MKEKARFKRQRKIKYLKLLIINRQYLELQALPISNLNPILKKILRKKNIYNKADTRALIRIEIIEREYIAHKIAFIANITYKEASITPLDNPP